MESSARRRARSPQIPATVTKQNRNGVILKKLNIYIYFFDRLKCQSIYGHMLDKKKANQPHAAETTDLHNFSSTHMNHKQCDRQENLNKNEDLLLHQTVKHQNLIF
jgi:hypothetical protein